MKLDEFKKQVAGLSPNTELILLRNGDYEKLSNIEIVKSEEGYVLDQQVEGITNKKVIILY
jgi:hypothetical protein